MWGHSTPQFLATGDGFLEPRLRGGCQLEEFGVAAAFVQANVVVASAPGMTLDDVDADEIDVPAGFLRGQQHSAWSELRATAFEPRGEEVFIRAARGRSEEHTSELQSLMRSSYAVFCLEQKKK